ncbi:MAG: hypothetical protein K2I20_01260 [Clostridia bacterium]|nr:hypothetical protein [Clostridia bacterium]
MKSIKKLLAIAATSALALTFGAVALTGCGGGGKDYSFEAEEALLTDVEGQDASSTMKVQENVEWSANGDGADITVVGYFATPGQTITWNVNAAEACDVTLKLRASSCKFAAIDGEGTVIDINAFMGTLWGGPAPDGFDTSTAKGYLEELKAADAGVVLKVNGEEKTMSGTLPAVTIELEEGNPWSIMGVYSTIYCGEYTVKVHLNKGANAIVLETVTGGINVDKLTVNSGVEITHTAIDNSDRLQVSQG